MFDVAQELLIDSQRLTPKAREHVAQCVACRSRCTEIEQLNVRLLQALKRPEVSRDLNDRVIMQQQRRRDSWRVAVGIAAAFVAIVGVTWVLAVRIV